MKLRKYILAVAILIAGQFIVNAQKFDFYQSTSKAAVNDKAPMPSVLCKMGSNYYLLRADNDGKVVMLDKYGADFKSVYSKTIADNSSAAEGAYMFLGFFKMKDHFIYASATAEGDKWTYTATPVSADGEPGAAQTLAEIENSDKVDFDYYHHLPFAVSPDGSKFVVYTYKYKDKAGGKKTIHKFIIAGADGKVAGTSDYTVPNCDNVYIVKACIDNTGKFYAISNVNAAPDAGEGKFNLLTGDANTPLNASMLMGDYNMASNQYFDLRISKKGDLLFSGLLLTHTKGQPEEPKAVFYRRINADNGQTIVNKSDPIAATELPKFAIKGSSGKGVNIGYQFQVVEGDDNDLYFLTEGDKDEFDKSGNLTGRETESIFVQHILSKGTVGWSSIIDKKQDLKKGYANYGSYSVINSAEKLFVLYNESPEIAGKLAAKGELSGGDDYGKGTTYDKPVLIAAQVNKADGKVEKKVFVQYGDNNSECVLDPSSVKQVQSNQLIFLSTSKPGDEFVMGIIKAK